MKIANIVYETELVNHSEVEYINYFKGHIAYDQLDKTLPTLYVGWSFMKACNPNNEFFKYIDILHKKIISNELYWECCFEESKTSHVKGIENFISVVPQYYFMPKFTYVNLDPVFFQISDLQELLDAIPNNIDVSYNFKNEMLYILVENKIFGINLLMYGFFRFNINDIIRSINERSKKIIDDLDGDLYMTQYKIFPNFNLLKRYLITILSK